MKRKMLVADLLCGAGGSSTGAQRALTELGLDMELVCVNHWPTAIETHTLNHPEARHYVQDIATVRPHLLVPEGYLDLLMASPTCTHHSVARGGKPTSDQQRSDPWHIITWLTELRVKRIIIENVWEFCGWGPVDHRTGKPIASRKGEYFHAWIETLKRLGFDPEWRKLNAADYGDATTRQRFILMARSDGRKVSWPMPTHGRRNGAKLDMFADTKPWRPAREIIDWQIKGRSIFGRKKALAPKTLARIYAGAVKFGWPEPFLVVLRQHMGGQSVDLPLPTIAANGGHIALAEPVIINGRKGNKAQAVSDSPIPTLDTKGGVWLAEPLVLSNHNSGAARTSDQPLPTITTGGAGDAERPGCARPMLVEPFILNRHGDGYGETRAHSVDEPTPTSNCDGGGYVVEPFVLSQASGGAPRGVSDPIPTAPTGGAHALIAAYYGANSTCTSEGDPLPTVTTKDRFGIVVPVTNKNGGAGARNIDADPIATMTTAKGGEFAIVMPVTHHGTINRSREVDEPLPTVTGANRGELAFITAQHGERQGQAPRVHDLDNPTPTIAATGHVDLVQATPEFDILFRMLEPHELAAAMGFNTDDAEYEFAGTKTEKIKQIGNAVSVSKMKACVSAIMADAAPKNNPAANDNKEPALAAA
ncbi:DNA cytosine methyltransferase [Mesorhizobium sp.]|uniref:DNA cytosine methyltransferase n=1 Tax=Mesorhizobium sp. TaxID=1871066 RepID=UPI000FEA6E7A|nr:DNA cytosine methyltransferase [Mesorhizobium sp.]RWO20682.1 MAG: DNA cytosine methyltransferase [Mesorhizobium sp.]